MSKPEKEVIKDKVDRGYTHYVRIPKKWIRELGWQQLIEYVERMGQKLNWELVRKSDEIIIKKPVGLPEKKEKEN